MKKRQIFLSLIYLLTLIGSNLWSERATFASSEKATTAQDTGLDRYALLEQIKETSLLNDIRWVENKGQLGKGRGMKGEENVGADPCVCPSQEIKEEFYDSIKYYAKTPWGYFLIKDDNEIVLNFIKSVKYQKGSTIILKEQPDWEETAKKELDLPDKKIAELRETGFVKANGKTIYLEGIYREINANACKTRVAAEPRVQARDKLRSAKSKAGALRLQGSSPNNQLAGEPVNPLSDFNLSYRSYNLSLSLDGKNPVKIEAKGERAEKQSYFKGNDPDKWVSGLTTYNEMWCYFDNGVIFRFYPKKAGENPLCTSEVHAGAENAGTELSARGGSALGMTPVCGRGIIEKEIIIPESAKLSDINLTYASEDKIELIPEGEKLTIKFDGYEFEEKCHFAYVIDDTGNAEEVKAEYVIRNQKLEAGSWKLETESQLSQSKNLSAIRSTLSAKKVQISSSWNGEGTFVFDPLLASTYLGGSADESGNAIALDTLGNVYITGTVGSTDFPVTAGAYETVQQAGTDVFISKLNSDLSSLLASTYLGGSYNDYGYSIDLDTSGNVYVAGHSYGSNFPVTAGAYDTGLNNDEYYTDVFISKLNSDLSSLLASTYLGGSVDDESYSIALDASGNVYVTGYSYGGDFPVTAGAFETVQQAGTDVFISKLNSDLSSLLASTYLGGSDYEHSFSIALDASGNVYVAGYSYGDDFPVTAGAYDTEGDGDIDYDDVFISKLNSDLSSLLASTYLGGSAADDTYSIALDASGNVYVAGTVGSTDFPVTAGAYDTSLNDDENYTDVFISKLNSDLSSLLASTYLGGSDDDYGYSIALDTSGNVYVTGRSFSADFPVTAGAYETVQQGYYDVFISKLNSDLSSLLAATYLGGSDYESGCSIALDTSGNVYVTGDSYSDGFPVTESAHDTSLSGTRDVFISKLSPDLCWMPYAGGNGKGDSFGASTDTPVGFGTKTKLIFTTSPSNSTAGAAFSTQPVVTIQDEDDNTVTSATDDVTVSINNNPNDGTLSGTATVAAVLGVATYPGAAALSINEPGYGYTLQAASVSLPTATSSAFNIGGHPWSSSISGSQLTDGTGRIRISYTANDIESNACNVNAAASLAQYSLDNSVWSNGALSGTTTAITATPTGTAHTDLYWEADTDSNNTENSAVYFRLKLNDGTNTSPSYETTSAFLIDTKAPVISSATAFSATPSAGSTTIQLTSTWTDSNSGSAASTFYYDLDGGGYSAGAAGSTGTLSPSATISVGGTLTGHSYFNAIKSSLTDSYGNVSAASENTTDVGVKPYTPETSTVQNATQATLDVIVNKNSSEADGLSYSIYVTPAVGGNNYVQADGVVGASAVWQAIDNWGTKTVTGLSIGTTYSFKTKSRNYHVTSVESEFSSTASLSTTPIAAKEYNLEASYKYVSSTRLEFLVWLEQGGQVITTGLSGSATVNIYDAEGDLITVTGNTDATPDSQGIYSMTTIRTSGAYLAGTSYYAKVQLPHQGTTYTENITIDVSSVSASLTNIESKIDTMSTSVDSILEDTATTLPARLTSMEGKIDTVDTVVDEILIDTGTTLPGNITTAKTDTIAEIAKGTQGKILNRPTTVKSGDTVTIRYKADSGLSPVPVIDVYNDSNTKEVDSIAMTEIGATGVYEYDLVLTGSWGTGDFTVICSESTNSSVDSMTLTVGSYDINQLGVNLAALSTTISAINTNVTTLLTQTSSIKTTVEDTNSDLASMQTNINTIITKWGSYKASDLLGDTGTLESYLGTPSDAATTDTIFGKIAQVYESTGTNTETTASTYAQNAYNEIQQLRNELNFNGKTETAYTTLTNLKDTLNQLQNGITTTADKASAQGTQELQDTVNQRLGDIKQMIASQGYIGAITEETTPGATSMTSLNNQLTELKAFLEVAKTLMEKTGDEPVIKSWFEME